MFYVVSTNTSRVIDSIRSKMELEAFLQEPVSDQQIAGLRRQILAMDGVDSVRLITKDEAARIFKEDFGEDVKSVLDFNPLPPSLKIFLKPNGRRPEKAEEISRAVRALKGVEEVSYRRDVMQFIEKQADVLYLAGLSIGGLIGVSAIFLIANTIRLTIYAKRRSIQTMKLVGASRGFVRAPFLLEGLVQGFVGGLIAAVAMYYLFDYASRLGSAELAEFIRVDTVVYAWVVGAGAFLGLFGSVISVRRFISHGVGA
jgi:cell division transport system permease protein